MAGALEERLVDRGGERRRAGDEQAHVRDERTVELRAGQEPGVEGRHAHHRRRPRQIGDHPVGVKAGMEEHRAAGEHDRVGGDEKAVGVEDRQRVQEHVVTGEAPGVDERPRVRGEVAVAQHGALGAPGRARGVEDRREIVGGASERHEAVTRRPHPLGERAIALPAEGLQPRLTGCCGGGQRRRARGVRHDDPRLGIGDEEAELVRRVGAVERQQDRARRQGGEAERDRLGGFLDLHRHPVARLDVEIRERPSEAARRGEHLLVGQRAAVGRLQQALARDRCRLQHVVDAVAHLAGPPADRGAVMSTSDRALASLARRNPPLGSAPARR